MTRKLKFEPFCIPSAHLRIVLDFVHLPVSYTRYQNMSESRLTAAHPAEYWDCEWYDETTAGTGRSLLHRQDLWECPGPHTWVMSFWPDVDQRNRRNGLSCPWLSFIQVTQEKRKTNDQFLRDSSPLLSLTKLLFHVRSFEV